MQLGNFSLSLAVKNLEKSREFYSALGFEPIAGEAEQGWLILKNGDTQIGLFEGKFDKNLLTFNPGWDSQGNTLENFTDVRELQRTARARGLQPVAEADESGSGPAHFTLIDPDGNPILFDQHI